MDPYKQRAIMEHVRRQGRLPTDRFGSVLPPEDLLVWFELNLVLTPDEQTVIRRELMIMSEVEALEDYLRSRAT